MTVLNIQNEVQLQPFNTLKLNAVASHYVEVGSKEMLILALEYAKQHQLNTLILSGGSNILLPKIIHALVIHIHIQGINVLAEHDACLTVHVGAGENWHEFVRYTTQKKWYGLQNLALIPGRVGASPVQNIGAYGVEVGEWIDTVEAYDQICGQFVTLTKEDCAFAYRDSVFKQQPYRYIIVAVVFKLSKQPVFQLNYGELKQAVADHVTIDNVEQQIIYIRQSKLPDPKDFPNVGSFFKNPLLSATQHQQLVAQFPHIPSYPQADGRVKVAAGWLIEHTGWKGKRLGAVGMFAKQALVLVNYEQANLNDVCLTYTSVQHDVQNKFNILLEPEPIMIKENGLIQSHIG